jgi:type IV pilus assembly protein PilV
MVLPFSPWSPIISCFQSWCKYVQPVRMLADWTQQTAVRNAQRGLTTLETLVTLIIILSGLLGLAGLQATVMQAELELYQRAHALDLMYDMVTRIKANSKAGRCYAIGTQPGAPALGTAGVGPAACSSVAGTSSVLAFNDLTDWDSLLKGAQKSSDGGKLGVMVDARGCVTRQTNGDNSVTYGVAVAWRGVNATKIATYPAGATTAAKHAIDCGKNQYDANAASNTESRRVVWTSFSVANLM